MSSIQFVLLLLNSTLSAVFISQVMGTLYKKAKGYLRKALEII